MKVHKHKTNEKFEDDHPSMMVSEIQPMSKNATTCLGIGIVTLTLMVSVLGVHTSLEAMHASAMQARYENEQAAALGQVHKPSSSNKPNPSTTDVKPVDKNQSDSDTSTENQNWSSVQLEWMQKNHITWNEYGLPVNEKGEVVDDPTTKVVETDRAKQLMPSEPEKPAKTEPDHSENDASISSDKTLEVAPNWWDGNDMISVSDNGTLYYVVQSGDYLSYIANKTGFTVQELADYNGICDANRNADCINVGQKIVFPLDGPTIVDKNVGLG